MFQYECTNYVTDTQVWVTIYELEGPPSVKQRENPAMYRLTPTQLVDSNFWWQKRMETRHKDQQRDVIYRSLQPCGRCTNFLLHSANPWGPFVAVRFFESTHNVRQSNTPNYTVGTPRGHQRGNVHGSLRYKLRVLDCIVTSSFGILYCGCFNLFWNVWVCVCVGYVMCGCFGNKYTCIYCVLYLMFIVPCIILIVE